MRRCRMLMALALIVFSSGCATVEAPQEPSEPLVDLWAEFRAELGSTDSQSRDINIPGRPGGSRTSATAPQSIVGIAPGELSIMMLDHIKRIFASHPEWGTMEEYYEFEKERAVRTDEQRVGLRTLFIRFLLQKEGGG